MRGNYRKLCLTAAASALAAEQALERDARAHVGDERRVGRVHFQFSLARRALY